MGPSPKAGYGFDVRKERELGTRMKPTFHKPTASTAKKGYPLLLKKMRDGSTRVLAQGKIRRPLSSHYAMLIDRFGIPGEINCT
jgi:hypothetical protein